MPHDADAHRIGADTVLPSHEHAKATKIGKHESQLIVNEIAIVSLASAHRDRAQGPVNRCGASRHHSGLRGFRTQERAAHEGTGTKRAPPNELASIDSGV